MKQPVQLWHIGEDKDGAETVLQSSVFGKELHEFLLQPGESVMVRDAKDTDYLVVGCAVQVDPAEITTVLENLNKLVKDLMPGISNISVRDYALVNEAPIAATKMIRRLKGGL